MNYEKHKYFNCSARYEHCQIWWRFSLYTWNLVTGFHFPCAPNQMTSSNAQYLPWWKIGFCKLSDKWLPILGNSFTILYDGKHFCGRAQKENYVWNNEIILKIIFFLLIIVVFLYGFNHVNLCCCWCKSSRTKCCGESKNDLNARN